jgi:hypothetical protein
MHDGLTLDQVEAAAQLSPISFSRMPTGFNVPNMVSQISTCLAAAKINIADLLNKSRGEYAYTLIDATARSAMIC